MLKKVFSKSFATILIAAMMATMVFNPIKSTAQGIPSITVSKTNVTLNSSLEVTIENGSLRDDAWVGLYEIDVTPDGDPTSIWWKYLSEVGVNNGNGTFTLDLSSIGSDRFRPSARYKLVLFNDDIGGYPIDASVNINLVDDIRDGVGDLEVLVVSDVHIGDSIAKEKFKKVLTRSEELLTNMDGILIAGDFTDAGHSSEYDNFMEVYNQYAPQDALRLWVMGNHDYWNGLLPVHAQDRFESKTGEKIHSHKILEGYHFIQVSTEGRETHGKFTDSLKVWLKEQLEMSVADDPLKPIFVTVHQHISNTVYGSHEWGNPALYDVLDDYPQVITFSGHSHYAIDDERSIHQRDFTSIGTASTNYMELERGKIQGSVPPGGKEFSEGLLMNVDKATNKVTLKRMDFYNDRVIKDDWVIEDPSDKTKYIYTDNRADISENPYFEDIAQLELNYIQPDTVRITFDQAEDEDMVHSYKIQAVNKSNGNIEKEVLAFSEFYNYPMPDKLSFDIDGLSSNVEHEIIVTALDSFGKESLEPLKGIAVRPTLTLSRSAVNINGTIEVTLNNGRKTPGNEDWIGLYEENETPDGDPSSIWWRTLPQLGITSDNGTFTFDPANIPSDKRSRYHSGQRYKFIFAYDDTYDIQGSSSFDITPATLTLSKDTFALDETIDITITESNDPTHTDDWIGLYEEGETPDGNPVSIWWAKLPDLGITDGEGTITFDPKDIIVDNKDRYRANRRYKFILAYDDTYRIEASDYFTTSDPIQQNLALGKHCSASSEQNIFHKNYPCKANDGNMSTRWCASNGDNNHWWKVDLGDNYNIAKTQVVWEYGGKVYKYKIDVSTDDSDWINVVDKTNNTSNIQIQEDNFTANARYVRITITGLEDDCWASIKEFKIFE
ncbi:discoidin domain-containing protein [Vallitalea guaymasensis]|uniref:discoidin domain-containing protein n=1 Tax=Vallitalea guaymasensis TaxID=1185412 RepID=UPI00272B14AC|nr:discoidin domain-containing protein [Vallitalea guaymasensis]